MRETQQQIHQPLIFIVELSQRFLIEQRERRRRQLQRRFIKCDPRGLIAFESILRAIVRAGYRPMLDKRLTISNLAFPADTHPW